MNKHIYHFIFASLACLILSCSKKEKLTLTGAEGSLIKELAATEYVLENPGDEDPLLFTINWTETLFKGGGGEPVPAAPFTYTLQVDDAGNNFDSAKVLAVTSDLSFDVHTKAINSFLMDSLDAHPGSRKEIEFRLLITYGQNGAGKTYSGNVMKIAVTPFTYSDPLQLMYIIGDMNGWNNTNTASMLPMFKENSQPNNFTYTFTGYIRANCFFKFLPSESLNSYKAYIRKDETHMEYLESEGGAFYNETAGYKTISIDLRNLTYTISDYNASGAPEWSFLGFIGAFCGWDNEPGMTRFSVENPHLWSLSLTLDPLTGGNTHPVKFRSNRSWGSRWAAIDPDALPYGKTIYLTGSEYDPNIVIKQGGEQKIIFNDLTGHYYIKAQ
ncbi:MAG: SusE domain-containing protein [Pseudobacter sp.]|uniref:SusE domain-containing protein n=1 Tax=Pseudobacter sp. TaxID=2045420 RepID=UPI003F7FDFC7